MELKDAGFKYQRKNVGLSKKGNNNLAERIFYEGSIENKEDIPILIGKDINAYYHSDAPNKKLRKEYKNLLKDNESTYYNKEIMDSREKLIWRQTAPYFIGTILRDKNYFGNTIQAGIIKDSFVNKISYEYLCGLLNSKYLRYLYENNVREIGKTFPQVKLEKLTGKRVQIKVQEIKNPNKDAQLVAESIATAIEKRVAYKRAVQQAIQRAEKAGIKGIKVMVSGRLNGAEIARSEWTLSGRVPLHTLRADVDYATATAHTTYGALGLKVWIFNGEVLSTTKEGENE